MLVQGAWAEGSCWNKVILPLKEKGYNVTGAQIPLPPPAQEFVAKRMNATVRSMASSHTPFMPKPQNVAAIISLAADSLIDQETESPFETVLAGGSEVSRSGH